MVSVQLQTRSFLLPPRPPLSLLKKGRRTGGLNFSCSCSSSPANIQILDILQNKVLIAAAVSGAIGQCSKPFTSRILYGSPNIDFMNAFRAGGFPSTHSSAAVAAAIAVGLERGFSDSIFGLAVVYAGLVMYDAQGVRREVGNHAKVINKEILLISNKLDKDSSVSNAGNASYKNSFPRDRLDSGTTNNEGSSLFQPRSSNVASHSLLKPGVAKKTQSTPLDQILVDMKGGREPKEAIMLKEAVGHTEIEVIAGALLGFFVSLVVCTTI